MNSILFMKNIDAVRPFFTLTSSVYHPLLRKQVPLAIKESKNEDSPNLELFWTLFNEALRNIAIDDPNRKFNPIGVAIWLVQT